MRLLAFVHRHRMALLAGTACALCVNLVGALYCYIDGTAESEHGWPLVWLRREGMWQVTSAGPKNCYDREPEASWMSPWPFDDVPWEASYGRLLLNIAGVATAFSFALGLIWVRLCRLRTNWPRVGVLDGTVVMAVAAVVWAVLGSGDSRREDAQRRKRLETLAFERLGTRPDDFVRGVSDPALTGNMGNLWGRTDTRPFLWRSGVPLPVRNALPASLAGRWDTITSLHVLGTRFEFPEDFLAIAREDLAQFGDLREMDLCGCSAQSFQDLPELPRVVSLRLPRAAIDPAYIAQIFRKFPHLRRLNLSECTLDPASMEMVYQNQDLEALSLEGCSISLEGIQYLSNLRTLSLSRAVILSESGIEPVLELKKLRRLDVTQCGNSRGRVSVRGIEQLAELRILFLSSPTPGEFQEILGLKELRSLGLVSSQVTLRGIEGLEKLATLSVVEATLNAESCDALQRLPSLRWIDLRRAELSESDPGALVQSLRSTDCQVETGSR